MRFTVRTLMLATMFAAVTLSACTAGFACYCLYIGYAHTYSAVLFVSGYWIITSLWFWLPIGFAVYAIGRRKLTLAMVIAFAVSEAAAVAMLVPEFGLLDAFFSVVPPPDIFVD